MGLYWRIGRDILAREAEQGWDAKVIDRLAQDLRTAFPDIKGFRRATSSTCERLRGLADSEIVQQAAAQLPWGHSLVLLDRPKEPMERLTYARAAIEHGWSRNVLNIHIETRLLELGAGFAFFGRQVLLDVGGEEFFLDLLFYHLKLRCYVVIELKAGKFKPEHLGQLGFYLTAVDRQVKHAQDNPSIGLLLCKSKNKMVAEYALAGRPQPMGIAEYKLVESLPQELQTSLPTIEQIERELSNPTDDGMEG